MSAPRCMGHMFHHPHKLQCGSCLGTAHGTGTTPGLQCDLQGLWRNELGSNMTLSALDEAGTFSGSYHTAVAATNKQILVSPLQGAQQHPGDKGQPTFGFTVHWQFAGTAVSSMASWVSQRFPTHAGNGFPSSCSLYRLRHPEKPWLQPQTSHTHSLLP